MGEKKTDIPSKPLTPAKEDLTKSIPAYDHDISRNDSQVTKVTNSLPPPPPPKKK